MNSFWCTNGTRIALLFVGALCWSPSDARAQARDRFELPESLQGLSGPTQVGPELTVAARIELTPAGDQGLLHVTAQLQENWHIYSVTQPANGPIRTRIVLEPSNDYTLAGEFQPDTPPRVSQTEFFSVPVEEHAEEVTWTAPIRVIEPTSPSQFAIRGRIDGQICKDQVGCIPLMSLDTQFEARVAGTVQQMPDVTAVVADSQKRRTPPVDTTLVAAVPASESVIPTDLRFTTPPAEGHRAGAIHTTLRGQIEPAGVAAGDSVTLVITAVPDPGWHVYAYAKQDPKAISKPLLIALVEPAGWKAGSVEPSEQPIVKQTGLPIEPEQRYYSQRVTWRMPIQIPADASTGEHTIKGMIGYQTCSDSQCDQPTAVYFAATVKVGAQDEGSVPLQFAPGKYAAVVRFLDGATAAPPERNAATMPPVNSRPTQFDLSRIQIDDGNDRSTGSILLLAFLGGFLLNFMPCVLPVIGLKIMSFVQQAGEHRSRVFWLNAVYSLGMVSTFWVLATLASAAALKLSNSSLGWGEQFNYDGFTIPLLSVVFVMALSFIGVWEIPIPGFVGSGKAGELAQREGLGGAYFKGVLTTILATPCTGPGVATAIAWSANKPPVLVYLVFTAMGLGMALPYLLIGAFPKLVRFIPKPGPWMETFKQAMGFVLLGTVVYMFTLISERYVVPTLALIFALWAACWWIGRTPFSAGSVQKLTSWLVAGAFAAIVGWFAFGYRPDQTHELPWRPYSLAALEEHVQANRTVMIDFTANWCPTCKLLERSVLNTEPVKQMVDKNDVVTLVADWSDMGDEIGELLKALGSKQIPVVAIFPAGDPYRPRKLSGFYTRSELVRALQAAGPSNSPRLAAAE